MVVSGIKEKNAANHRRFIVVLTLACLFLYYAHFIAKVAGLTALSEALSYLHNFYGIDFYAMMFFAPVVYAAHTLGIREALFTTILSVLLIIPESVSENRLPFALLRPAAFGIIMGAVGATIALLQRSDEVSRRNMQELSCLYDIGRSAEGGMTPEIFFLRVIEIIRHDLPFVDENEFRINYRARIFSEDNFAPKQETVVEPLTIGNEAVGSIEINYPPGYGNTAQKYPFTRQLAERIGETLHRIELGQSLKRYSEQLESMVRERTKDLEQAQVQLRLLSNTVKSSFDGITLADMQGRLTFANEAAGRMWGAGPGVLARFQMSDLYTAAGAALLEREIIPGAQVNPWSGELTAIRQDGREFTALTTISPVRDEKGETVAIVGVHRDTSETKSMREKLIRSERLAAVGEMASSVGHELRNPLNVIRNCVYLLNLTLGEKLDKETQGTIQLLDRQVDASNKIVTDLLEFTRVRPPFVSLTGINALLKESAASAVTGANIKVVMDLDEASPQSKIDGEQIGRALVNLIINAAQSIVNEGEIRLRTAVEEGQVIVSIGDTGCGITPENLEKLFEPLFTTKTKGTGLGLAIARRLIERNSGTIRVESKVGEGTTFTVRLPLARVEVNAL